MTHEKFQIGATAKMFGLWLIVASASPVFAVQTWDMTISSGSSSGNLNNLCASVSSIATGSCGPGLSVSGWSTGTGAVGSTNTTPQFNVATVYDWGTAGLGVVASNENPNDTGPHATDNRYGTDAMLLNFTTASNLSGVKIGWNGTDNGGTTAYIDSDMSIFAWTGSGTPLPASTTLASMTSIGSGWSLVGNYFNVGSVTSPTANAIKPTSTIYSSYWLVSAYNAAYGGTDDGKVDAFKVLAISAANCTDGSTCPSRVPEPGSLALFGAAMIGLVTSRRNKRKVA